MMVKRARHVQRPHVDLSLVRGKRKAAIDQRRHASQHQNYSREFHRFFPVRIRVCLPGQAFQLSEKRADQKRCGMNKLRR